MNEFLKDIYATVFFEYCKNYDYEGLNVEITEKQIRITTDYSLSTITVYEGTFFEFQVVNTYNDDIEFFLHFQLKTINHALQLFEEMIDIIHTLIHQPKTKVLLSCTSGFTTTYFSDTLNEAATVVKKDYIFDAVAYTEIDDVINDFDIVLLAPQISYEQAYLQERYPYKIIINIPLKIFGQYNCGELLKILDDTREIIKKTEDPVILRDLVIEHKSILTMAIIRNNQRVHIGYRVFDHENSVLDENHMIKNRLRIEEICDLIDMILDYSPQIEAICISIPGIINDGVVVSMTINGLDEGTPFERILKERYHQKILLINDVNAAALGYYACQRKYNNISLIFLPLSSSAGIGNIINGQLHVGYKSIAGETQYLPIQLSDNRLVLNKTAEGTLELLSKESLALISLLAPEVIVIVSGLLKDIDTVKTEVLKTLPVEYCPEFVQISYLEDYTYIGCLIHSIRELY